MPKGKEYKIKYGGAITGPAEYKALDKSIKKSIRTGNWQLGEEAEKFVQEASAYLGVKYGAICNSGSSAGLLALAALELPKGSEVIIPAVTFPTIFNIIPQLGLIPVVVDCIYPSYNASFAGILGGITEKTRAIIVVHAVGNPVDMPKLMKYIDEINSKRENKIYVVEDNCDGWGSTIDINCKSESDCRIWVDGRAEHNHERNNKKVGSFGDISFTSFHAAHIVSMGVGGGVFTDNPILARNVGMYRDWGRQANLTPRENTEFPNLPRDQNPRFIYEKLGYNFNCLELQAAMGRVQLKKTEKIKKARKRNFDYLYNEFQKMRMGGVDLVVPQWTPNADVCWFSFPLTIDSDRAPLLKHLEDNGIETRTMFAGNILKHPSVKGVEFRQVGDLKCSDFILEHSFWVGLHPRYTPKDLKYMVDVFKKYFNA